MTDSTSVHLRIVRELLLSSPPGQFDVILEDLRELLSSPPNEWIEKIRMEYNTLTGRQALFQTTPVKSEDPLGLQEGMKLHVDKYYSGKGVQCNYVIDSSFSSGSVCSILLYAERIQLQQFHAGSWTAKYNITKNDNNILCIKGKAILHAHAFENGNVQLKTTVEFPSVEITSKNVFQQIQIWDESLVESLTAMYDEISSDALKKFRRVMPVTRTRFDWNLLGHRGIRQLGAEVQKEKGR
eukprot:CAMPEP_0176478088 /NCGR_PEP_ID=MMETSP0200_2-20121128/997_1 /TAXON_ID=947934 /ORGANISM="Chaetoceros sp., Strain GSL56" /LENGTH=239 /DNA_ID=CAMNT_0017873997 /DNA_START=78 /DNA_END=797 /DNA_ORIENTATION=-